MGFLSQFVQIGSHFKENAKRRNPPLRAPLPLTTMKYRIQSAEQRVSNTKVILPSSEPMAPVIDVGGLFNRLKLRYLQHVLNTTWKKLHDFFH